MASCQIAQAWDDRSVLAVGLGIERGRIFGVEIAQLLAASVAFEEALVRADDLAVLSQPLHHAFAQVDDALDAVFGQEGVAADDLGSLADAVDAPRPLRQADDSPGQVVVHDDAQSCRFWPSLSTSVDSSTRISRSPFSFALLLRGLNRRASGRRVVVLSRRRFQVGDAAPCQLLMQVVDGVRELREDQHFLLAVPARDEFAQRVQLGVGCRIPGARPPRDFLQALRVPLQRRPQVIREERRSQPAQSAARLLPQLLVGGMLGPVFFVGDIRVQPADIQRADGQVPLLGDGMQEDLVALDMPLQRKHESAAAALQPLEEVGAAEAHQPLARPREVVHQSALGRSGGDDRVLVDVLPPSHTAAGSAR